MTIKLNAQSYTDILGQSDLITVAENVQQDADFFLGAGNDILSFQPTGTVNGIDVRTGVGNDTIHTSNGDDDIWATGAGKKSIIVGNGEDNVHLDVVPISSSFVDLHDSDQAKDTIFFSGQQVNFAGGVGEHTVQGVGFEDQFKFKDYGKLFVHDVDNTVPGAFDYVTRGSFDGPAVVKFLYEPGILTTDIHPTLHNDGLGASGFHNFTMTFQHDLMA